MSAIQWNLEDYFFVHMSEPRKFKEGLGQKRKGFAKTKFDAQYYVVITLTDHSAGHGVVKAVTLRNPAVEFLQKIQSPEYWEVRKMPVTLVTQENNHVDRTFRVVYLRTPSGDALMSNDLETQLKNLASNSMIRVNGQDEKVIAYVASDNKVYSLVPKEEEAEVEAVEAEA